MNIPAIDLRECLLASLAVQGLARLEVDSNMRYSAVQHWIDLLTLEAGESLTQSTGLLVEHVAPLQCLNDLFHLDVIEADVLTALITTAHPLLFLFLSFCHTMLVIILVLLLFLFHSLYHTSFLK